MSHIYPNVSHICPNVRDIRTSSQIYTNLSQIYTNVSHICPNMSHIWFLKDENSENVTFKRLIWRWCPAFDEKRFACFQRILSVFWQMNATNFPTCTFCLRAQFLNVHWPVENVPEERRMCRMKVCESHFHIFRVHATLSIKKADWRSKCALKNRHKLTTDQITRLTLKLNLMQLDESTTIMWCKWRN